MVPGGRAWEGRRDPARQKGRALAAPITCQHRRLGVGVSDTRTRNPNPQTLAIPKSQGFGVEGLMVEF